ncbi:zona pellucida sperm-binding protein 1-like [Corythoichthys intestinalis]|uniref:zona pellucida sperm-binding protein 1-like n=1 Tax=Corythoichthys intestinalis TaxID=161448 RepID=UPI0025A66613|nr:zona pellucida sperm-binding protein 1-like [Corythoichthys intestinalis]XP_061808453.1 zona pellucida sperm-binding protein 1-like [Nerophis lumbriciformis]
MARLWLLVVLNWSFLVLGQQQGDEKTRFEEMQPEITKFGEDYGSRTEYDDDEEAFPDPEAMETSDPDSGKGAVVTYDGVEGEPVEVSLSGWTSSIDPSQSGLQVSCDDKGFRIILPAGQLNDVQVFGSQNHQSNSQCGLNVTHLENTLTVPFTGCYEEDTDRYSLQLLYKDDFDEDRVATVTCHQNLESTPGPLPRAGAPASKCRTPPPPQTPPKALHCAMDPREQIQCGYEGISPPDCKLDGCCVDPTSHKCFYPMNECTVDRHFVFIIRSTYASTTLDPTELVIPGTDCKPVVVNADFAIFKFKVTECGTRTYDIGMTRFYLAEVQTLVRALNLKYGIITRTDPLRFLVECRYSLAAHDHQPFASVGYMVKIPSRDLPSSIPSDGLYGVELRIATDKTFSTFLPSVPTLRYILGKPVYLELRLLSPKPNAILLVKYCLAYPRSAKNALVLVYEGCANPNDPNVSILQMTDLPQNRHQRHFEVKAFQFMDVKTKLYLNEQIQFMCSAEVCRSDEKICEERCFDGKVQ